MDTKDIIDAMEKAAVAGPVTFLATKATEYAYIYIIEQQTEQQRNCTTEYNKGYNEGWKDGFITGASISAGLAATVAIGTALSMYYAQRKQPSSHVTPSSQTNVEASSANLPERER